MAVLKCKMCGGDIEVNEEKTFGTCEYCGSVMTLPKVSDDQRAARFNRGNHFRRQGEFDKALAVYETIVNEDDADAEAHWCCALCRFGIEYVEDPNTYEYLPTCHRASFDSFLEDPDYLAALENSDGITRRQYQKDAAKIAEVQRGILATSQNEEPFDVFICYKETDDSTKERTRDSLDAQDIYYQLTQEGYRVFFSRITLEDKVGAEYEPYIFAALNSAKVMIAVGSKPEYFNAVWVKNEWSRFLALMRKDRSKLLLPCYKGMDPYDLPEQLGVLQSYDMAKIGFMQDLIHGVKKVLKKDEPKDQPLVVAVNAGSNDIAPLIKRMFMYLEDGEWDKANEYSERVLDKDPENAEAYVGKLMAELRVCRKDDLKNQAQPFGGNKHFQKAFRFGDEKLKNELISCINFIIERNAEEKRKEEEKKAAEIEANYTKACSLQDSGEEDQLSKAVEIFKNLKDYKDSEERLTICEHAYEEKKSEREEREEKERVEREEREKQERDTKIKKLKPLRERASYYKRFINVASFYTLGLKEDGTVIYAGDHENKRRDFSNWKDIVLIAIGQWHAVGLKEDGTVVAVGSNDKGECNVSNWRGIMAIAAGSSHTVGLKSDGTVVAVGRNDSDQCSVSDWHWRDIVAIATSSDHTIGLKSDGTAVAAGKSIWDGKWRVSDWKNVVAVSATIHYAFGLKADGTVIAVEGDERRYSHINVENWKDIVAIESSRGHTVGLRSDGTVVAYTFGRNSGECNVSDWNDIVAISPGDGYTVGLKADGTVVAVGNNEDGQCNVSDWKDIVAIAAGDYHTVGLKSDGTVVAVGKNDSGQCNVSGWKLFNTEAEKEKKSSELNAEKTELLTEFANLKGIFSGKRRKEIETRLTQINSELKRLS